MIASLLKKFAYRAGLIGLVHRLKNRNSLTVIMFHRVLSPRDPRWQICDPDYTISDALFTECLAFFRRHYSVVSLEQVLAARRGTTLPPNPLLITFDDGWWDNFAYALPALQRAQLPAVLFTVADAVGQEQAFFQEQLICAWRSGRLGAAQLQQLLQRLHVTAMPTDVDDLRPLRAAIAQLERMTEPERQAALLPLQSALADDLRQMISAEELAGLAAGGMAIGLHGKTHTPMTQASDIDAELAVARGQLHGLMGGTVEAPVTLSFPHGKWNEQIVRRARESGYALMFTSVPALNPLHPRLPDVIGRVGFETATITDKSGRFCPELLALYLFRRPSTALAVD